MIDKTIFGLILLVGAVIVVLFIGRRTEGFASGVPKYDTQTRRDYVESSIKKYNPLAAQYDVTRANFARTDDPAQLDRVTRDIKSAMMTAEISPDPSTGSRFGVNPRDINVSLPPPNQVLVMARKCETIQGRGCDALKNPEYAACGICIKDGTSFSQPDKPGKHIGGLLVLPDDRKEAESKAGRGEPTYFPTVGECAPGYLYLSADKCTKAVNRLDCMEAGKAGGFDGAMKEIARSKCAQVVHGDGNTYVYEPRGRKFRVNLRVVTPTGTGDIGVYILKQNGDKYTQIGSYLGADSGKEILIPINSVGEADELAVFVFEKFPHRPRGRNEVFQVIQADRRYGESRTSSEALCNSMGARLATKEELEDYQRKGGQVCACGYTTSINAYPMNDPGWTPGCGMDAGIKYCGTTKDSWNEGGGNTWCYGIKPPLTQTPYSVPKFGNIPAILRSHVFSFYEGKEGGIWSEHGSDYQAPAYRGVILQWESEDGMRVVPFEPTIVKVNDMAPSSESSDGTKTFSNLRRLGTYAKSSMILSPRPSGKMLSNQFWIWSNLSNSVYTSFTVKVPGIFMDPFYSEDKVLAPRGPLISTPEMMKLMRTSPCLRAGEVPGKYSIDCLTSLFRSAGGDPLRGKLAVEGGGLTQLLKHGDMDAISAYLANLFSIATKGRDSMGNRVGMSGAERIALINDAAQKLFGFDLTTPCEDVVEDAAGNMRVVSKTGPFNADCLDYLWMNTGNDRQRGNEDTTRKTALQNTYTTLYDRYSGLRSNEGSAEKRKQHPFQACQRSGSKAPIGVDGKPNEVNIAEANRKGGNILSIQNWYDQIHQSANYMSPSADMNETKKAFVKQCYGIQRIDNVPGTNGCKAVPARYVRVLATGIASSTNPNAACIQIPQLQVFDSLDKEVARGKPTSAHSVWLSDKSTPDKAVNGDARPKSHGEGEYHDNCATPDRQFWMVDLGSTVQISRVVYYPRTDCCTYRQIAAPVQLLDERKQIVAQKWIGQDDVPINQVQNLIFTPESAKPIFPRNMLNPGLRFSLQSSTSYNRYLRHSGFSFWSVPETSDSTFKQESTFILVPARNGNSSMVSFESVSFPNRFLRHAGFRCWLHFINSALDKDDSSFTIVNALNGDPSMVSFRSANFPQYYLSTRREAPNEIWITTVDTSNVWDVQRASWKFTQPFA
jgi:hypothetical protein